MYIEGSKRRLFLSTKIGCSGGCTYCYLPYLRNGNVIHDIDRYLSSKKVFEKGKDGTLLSIGCYTDPFLEENVNDTLNLIKYLTKFENYIQIATKFILSVDVINQIINLRKYPSHISIYYSCPTLSQDYLFEKNCPSANDRIKNLIDAYNAGIPTILYIKPFIENVTKNDFELYKALLMKYCIPVVVGSHFTNNKTGMVAPVGCGFLNVLPSSEDYHLFIKNISKLTYVFENSTEVINLFNSGGYNYGYF